MLRPFLLRQCWKQRGTPIEIARMRLKNVPRQLGDFTTAKSPIAPRCLATVFLCISIDVFDPYKEHLSHAGLIHRSRSYFLWKQNFEEDAVDHWNA